MLRKLRPGLVAEFFTIYSLLLSITVAANIISYYMVHFILNFFREIFLQYFVTSLKNGRRWRKKYRVIQSSCSHFVFD